MGTPRRGSVGAAHALLRWLPFQPSPRPLSAAPALRSARPTPAQAWLETRVAVRRHRRLIAAGLIGLAATMAIGSLTPKPPRTVAIVTASRDLAAGATLTHADVRSVAVPTGVVPAGAITNAQAVVGRRLTGPLRRGEPLTDVRLDVGILGVSAAGLVSVPVRLADAQAANLLRPGQRVDVLAANTTSVPGLASAAAAVVAADVAVVAMPLSAATTSGLTGDPNSGTGLEGALVVLATTIAQARQLAQAQVSARLSAVVVG